MFNPGLCQTFLASDNYTTIDVCLAQRYQGPSALSVALRPAVFKFEVVFHACDWK
jgi:hypothetical protein